MKNRYALLTVDTEALRKELGINMDKQLATETRHIDVILGGHSHTFMEKPQWFINADGQQVPVMHTGKNGIFVGRIDLILHRK